MGGVPGRRPAHAGGRYLPPARPNAAHIQAPTPQTTRAARGGRSATQHGGDAGHLQTIPGGSGQRPGGLGCGLRFDSCPVGGERSRQVNVDAHPERPVPARLGNHEGRGSGRLLRFPAARNPSRRGHGAPALHAGRNPDRRRKRGPGRSSTGLPHGSCGHPRNRRRTGSRKRTRDRSGRPDLAAVGRRAAKGGDRQDAPPGRPSPDPGRTHGRADTAGGGHPL